MVRVKAKRGRPHLMASNVSRKRCMRVAWQILIFNKSIYRIRRCYRVQPETIKKWITAALACEDFEGKRLRYVLWTAEAFGIPRFLAGLLCEITLKGFVLPQPAGQLGPPLVASLRNPDEQGLLTAWVTSYVQSIYRAPWPGRDIDIARFVGHDEAWRILFSHPQSESW